MKIVYNPSISHADQELLKQSRLFQAWFQKVDQAFKVESIEFQSADLVQRHGVRTPLFIKLLTTATDASGRQLRTVVFLRGNAVAVLPVLNCEGTLYTILVKQARFAMGAAAFPEIPAGMMDDGESPLEVAIRELAEETSIEAQASELTDLAAYCLGYRNGVPITVGVSDERIHLFLFERCVSQEFLYQLEGKLMGQYHENEYIQVKVLPLEQIAQEETDGKTLMAWMLWQQYLLQKAPKAPQA
jgi:ADP-sugar diphosphatase